jgi:hypothetical protein
MPHPPERFRSSLQLSPALWVNMAALTEADVRVRGI